MNIKFIINNKSSFAKASILYQGIMWSSFQIEVGELKECWCGGGGRTNHGDGLWGGRGAKEAPVQDEELPHGALLQRAGWGAWRAAGKRREQLQLAAHGPVHSGEAGGGGGGWAPPGLLGGAGGQPNQFTSRCCWEPQSEAISAQPGHIFITGPASHNTNVFRVTSSRLGQNLSRSLASTSRSRGALPVPVASTTTTVCDRAQPPMVNRAPCQTVQGFPCGLQQGPDRQQDLGDGG